MIASQNQGASGLRQVRLMTLFYAFGVGGLALFVIISSGLCGINCGPDTAAWITLPTIVLLMVISFFCGITLIRKDPTTIWTPAALFPLSTGLFLGFGSLSVFLSTDATKAHILAGTYPIDAVGFLRTLPVTTVGVAVCALAMWLFMSLRFGAKERTDDTVRRKGISLSATAWTFFIFGAVLKYGFVLPAEYGVTTLAVPGALKALTALIDLGFAVMAYLAARGNKKWLLVLLVLWPIHFGMTALEFKKRTLVLAILLPAVGAYLAHKNRRRLIAWGLVAMLAYTFAQNINTTARQTIYAGTGSILEAGFEERFSILSQILSGNLLHTEVRSSAGVVAQIWWLRLNYAGAQLEAIEYYDTGAKGEWTLSIPQVFIPRFLWPNKPSSSQEARNFYRQSTNNDMAQTSVGITIYADGYWKFGWIGVVMFSAMTGALLGALTRISYRAIIEKRLIMLPVVFLSMQLAALSPMGFLQQSVVASLPILLAYLLLIFILETLIRSFGKTQYGRPVMRYPAQATVGRPHL